MLGTIELSTRAARGLPRLFRDLSPAEQLQFLKDLWTSTQGIGLSRDPEMLLRVREADSLELFLVPEMWFPNAWSRKVRFWSARVWMLIGGSVLLVLAMALVLRPATVVSGLLMGSVFFATTFSIVLKYMAAQRYAVAEEHDLAAWGEAMRAAIAREWRGYE